MRRLFDALVLPTVSYASEVWGPSCSPSLLRDIKKMGEVQLAFFWQLCRLKKSVTPAIIFRELSERPWVHRWWNQVIGFMHRLSNMPHDRIHAEISGTTLLTPGNTLHVTTGLVALSSSTAVLAWPHRFHLLALHA